MCKDTAVFDIETCEVLKPNLTPGQLLQVPTKETFRIWTQSRYSSQTNVTARLMQGRLFGQGNRKTIDRVTRSLSLSDCYWIKARDDTKIFREVSPYFNDFWKGSGVYENQAIPTLYVDGMLPKYWESANWLVKEAPTHEVDCFTLCKCLELPVAEVVPYSHGTIAVRNFTSADIMFEAADTSGRLDVADFTMHDIAMVFGNPGIAMLTIDAIIGNIDRHTGNFGFLRDANTGEYIGMAPLFDFDHALDPDEIEGLTLLKSVGTFLKETHFSGHATKLVEKIQTLPAKDIFKQRAKVLLDVLNLP